MNRSMLFKPPDVMYLHEQIPVEDWSDVLLEAHETAMRGLDAADTKTGGEYAEMDVFVAFLQINDHYAVIVYVSDQSTALVIAPTMVALDAYNRYVHKGGCNDGNLVDERYYSILHNADCRLFYGTFLN